MTYSGIFIRDNLGQTPTNQPSGWSACPDIILYGPNVAVPNTSIFTTTDGYATDYGSNVNLNQKNNVYLRGLNATSGAFTSHIFFYHVESSLALWPKNWSLDNITVNGQNQNWNTLTATAANQVVATPTQFVWTPPPPRSGNHYCVISWADNNPTTLTPPDLNAYSEFSTLNDLIVFIQAHPNMGWRNTNDIYGSPPYYKYSSPLSFQSGGGSGVMVYVQFINIPPDGTFNVTLQGTDSTNTINLVGAKVSDYQGGYTSSSMSFPANFATSVDVEWFRGNTDPPPNAMVKVHLTQQTSPPLFELLAKVKIPVHTLPVFYLQPNDPNMLKQGVGIPTPVNLVGSLAWNMKYGQNPPA